MGQMGQKERVRLGIVGLGIGQWHLEEFRKVPGAEVVALCDKDERKLTEVGERYGIRRLYKDYGELMEDPKVDAVSICLPNYLHAPAAVAALDAGKHVLVEKPLARTPEEAEEIVRAKDRSGKKAMVAMKLRFLPESAYIRKLSEEGQFGEVYYGFNTYIRPVGEGIPKGWFYRKELSGGGALIDNGVHLLDLNWYLMGCPRPVQAFGVTYAKFGPKGKGIPPEDAGAFDVDDFACGIVLFEDGASILIENGWAAHVGGQTMEVRVFGTEGGASVWPFYIVRERDGRSYKEVPDLRKFHFPNQFQHFVECILRDEEPISSLEEGVTVLRMLVALYRSSEEGRSVPVDNS